MNHKQKNRDLISRDDLKNSCQQLSSPFLLFDCNERAAKKWFCKCFVMKPPSEQIHSGSSLYRGCFSCNHFESYLSWLLIIIGINWEHQESVDLICWINFGKSWIMLSRAWKLLKFCLILSSSSLFAKKLFCTLHIERSMRDAYEEETKNNSINAMQWRKKYGTPKERWEMFVDFP